MGALWKELVVIGVALGAVWLVVERTDDGATLVTPPELVAEEFVERVIGGRYGPAPSELAPSLAESLTVDSLRTFARAVEEGLGEVAEVEGKLSSRLRTDVAVAIVHLSGSGGGRASLRVTLERKSAGDPWRITALGRS